MLRQEMLSCLFFRTYKMGLQNSGILQALLEYGDCVREETRQGTYDKLGREMAARKVAVDWSGMYLAIISEENES